MSTGDLRPLIDMLADDVRWWPIGEVEPIVGKAALVARVDDLAELRAASDLHDLFANDEHMVALIHAVYHQGTDSFNYSSAEVYHLDGNGLINKRQAFASDGPEIRDRLKR